MKCPGQDTRYWKSGAIFEATCPKCGHGVEFFKDDTTRRCKGCGHKFLNPKMDFGCASYCQYAEQCLGDLPPELETQKEDLLKEKKMKVKRKVIEIDDELCDGCGQCVPSCAEGAIQVIDGKARLVAEKYCDGLGACLGECPTGALSIAEREAEEFDEEAVEEHLGSIAQKEQPHEEASLPCGCPSTKLLSFTAAPWSQEDQKSAIERTLVSALSHWPVQIRLVPATAPFLKGADLLVAADCTPVAYANFHQDFLKGRVVLVGCPKFDDAQEYVQKFAEIFNTADIESITAVVMEVPCCEGLPRIVEKGMKMAGKRIPLEKVVISSRGEVLERKKMAA